MLRWILVSLAFLAYLAGAKQAIDVSPRFDVSCLSRPLHGYQYEWVKLM